MISTVLSRGLLNCIDNETKSCYTLIITLCTNETKHTKIEGAWTTVGGLDVIT